MTSKKEQSGLLSSLNSDWLTLMGRLGLRTVGMKLSASLLFLTGISILVAGVVSFMSFRSAIESNEQMRRSASAMAEAVDLLVMENIQFVRSIAADEAVVEAAERAAREAEKNGIKTIPAGDQIVELEQRYKSSKVLARDEAANQVLQEKRLLKGVFDRVFFTDRYGLNAGMTSMTDDFVQSDEHWWREAMRSGFYIEDVEFDRPSGKFSVEICVAVPSRSGGPNGVLKAKYNLQDAQDYVGRFRQYDTGYAYALSKSGRFVLHPDPDVRNLDTSELLQRRNLSETAALETGLAEMVQTDRGGMLYYDGSNPKTGRPETRLAFVDRSQQPLKNDLRFPGFGWTFVVDNSEEEMFAPAYRMLGSLGIAGAIAFVVLGALSLFFSRSFSKKIETLRQVTEDVSNGDLTPRASIASGDDLEKLAHGFNQMIDRLSEVVENERRQREEIAEREADFRSLFDDAPVGYHEVDAAGRITRVNRTELSMLGYGAGEMIGKHVNDFFVGETSTLPLAGPAAGSMSVAVERTYRKKDGSSLLVLLEDRLIRDGQGNVVGARSTIQDITARKEAEQALKDMQALFNSVLESLTQNIFCKDKEGRFTYANRAFCETMGKPIDQILGRNDFDFFPKDLAVKYRQDDQRVIESEKVTDTVEENVAPDGTRRYVQVVKAPRYDFEGEIAGVQGIFWDVTERKQIEEALRLSEEKYRNILENIEDGFYEVTLSGDLLFCNEPVARLLGYPLEQLKGLNHKRYVKKDLLGHVQAAFNKVYKTGDPIRELAYEVTRPDGTERSVETSISLVTNGSGQPAGFRGIIRDVTERRRAEAAIERGLKEFLDLVSLVSAGDLTRRGPENEDTFGQVIQSVNGMLDRFAEMLTQVKQIGLSVSSSATEILAASEQIAAGSQRQADEITNTSSAVEEMAASMSQVSRNAEASAGAARRALDMAEHGDRAVKDTSEAMTRIDGAVQQTAEKMRLLGVRSSEISEIIDLIDEIAAQTNLLALNAAIEAAHAGEAGLGFSVVAEEIRKLAERSARATRDVGNLIKAIQTETSQALSAMENGMAEVEGGSKLAGQASKALLDISEAVRQSSELIEEISAASEEQARVTRNLAGAMQTISSITLETSAGAHQTAQTIQGMVALSEQLNKAISQFKIKDDFVHPFSYNLPGSPPPNRSTSRSLTDAGQGD